jgi:hypothetical protein
LIYHCRSGNVTARGVFDTREAVCRSECLLYGETPEDRNFGNRTVLSLSEIPKVGRTRKLEKGRRIICDD